MNVHACPVCGRMFFCRVSLDESEKVPKHSPPGQSTRCSGVGKLAVAERPPHH